MTTRTSIWGPLARAVRTEPVTAPHTGRLGGFWVPMGEERSGPAFSAYDEFLSLRTSRGEAGHGVVEQGILRTLA